MKQRTGEHKSAIKNSIGRIILVALLVLLQILAFVMFVVNVGEKYPLVALIMRTIALLTVLGINARDKNSSMRLIWVIIILIAPIAGVALFFVARYNPYLTGMKKRLNNTDKDIFPKLVDSESSDVASAIKESSFATQARYLKKNNFPTYSNTSIKYYDCASDCYRSQLDDIKNAKKYVYLEYHAIENSEAFEPLHQILKRKVSEGVDCRILYDDIGSFVFVNRDFMELLNSEGIKCNVFNRAMPVLSIFMNNRDHRKITVIDDRIAYTGGFNIADEYFNIINPYGYWKDTGVRLEGPATDSFKAMFIEMWNFSDLRSKKFSNKLTYEPTTTEKTDGKGFVIPYCDSPIDDKPLGENVYINALNNAKDFCWFMSPYLVISDELNRAFVLAAQRGVDVRIITPGIPDKRTVYSVTRSYYKYLAVNGVKIYEFTPGFCHAKMCLADDKYCVVGTINLDYRSLYHHFENAILMCECDCIPDIRDDFMKTFDKCRDVTKKAQEKSNIIIDFAKSLLRLVAPLL